VEEEEEEEEEEGVVEGEEEEEYETVTIVTTTEEIDGVEVKKSEEIFDPSVPPLGSPLSSGARKLTFKTGVASVVASMNAVEKFEGKYSSLYALSRAFT
jgi:hypothetical protein